MRPIMLGTLVILSITFQSFGQEAAPATAPTTAPAADEMQPASVTPEAQAILNDMRQAYSSLSSLDLTGRLTADFDAAGQKQNQTADFTASYQSPAKFRHEMKDDLLLVSNGQNAYVYKIDAKQYLSLEAPKSRTAGSDLPVPINLQLQQQNPSLLLSLTPDAARELTQGVQSVERGPDVKIDNTSYQALHVNMQGQQVRMLVDPQTHLLRQMQLDLKPALEQQGTPQVNKALVTIDYTKSAANGPVAESGFNWSPPADAQEVKPPAQEEAEKTPADDLVGQPAPEFTLKDLSGNDVTLSSQKGSVVVLDFWATWCPPCRKGLPHLSQLNQELSGKGVKVFAVNQKEDKEKVQKFLDENKLQVPVVLDSEGKVGDEYKVTGIPQTVVIGKDGTVSKVFVGFGPGSEKLLRQAVEAAMK